MPEQIWPGARNDLALVKLPSINHPCILFGAAAEPMDPVWTQGYVSKQGEIRLEPVIGEIEGERRVRLESDGGEQSLIKFKGGQIVPGMSGAPLLNFRSGAVCGIVIKTLNEANASGGLAIPIRTILSCYPFITERQAEFHKAHSDWRLAGLTMPAADLTKAQKIELVGAFPPGPLVPLAVVPTSIISSFYELTVSDSVTVVMSANNIRRTIEPTITPRLVTLIGLPNPDAGLVNYWLAAFTQAAARGPRMIAALVYEAPPNAFVGNETELWNLLATLRAWPIS